MRLGSYYTWQGQCIYDGGLYRLIPYKNPLTESTPPAFMFRIAIAN